MKGGTAMSSLVVSKYSPIVNEQEVEFGDKSSPIWLLINPKYLADYRTIWTPILEVIQDKVYRQLRRRINSQSIFVKYAASDIGIIPNSWRASVIADEITLLKESILKYRPTILITFGAVAYELARRIVETKMETGPNYWNTVNLENEFEQAIAKFNINRTNQIPLPRRFKKPYEDDDLFSWDEDENYVREIGTKIADKVIENKDNLKIWIE